MLSIPGRVTTRITLLGRPESCVYLVDGGSESMLIEGGTAYVAPDLLRQIETFGIDESKIKRLIILHSHFDHCGLVPFFKKRWPWVTVSASARAKQLLSDPKVTQRIRDLNQAAISRAGLDQEARQLGFTFTQVEVEETLADGDVISCGDFAAEAIAVPGHSSCSIALYIPEEKALFVSDAAGVRHKDFFLPTGNSNYDLYQAGLEKMAQYDVDVVLAGHFGVADGKEAHDFLAGAIEESKRGRVLLEASYKQTRDVEQSTEELVRAFMAKAPENFLSREVYEVIIGQMMRYIARCMDNEPTSHP